MELRGYQSDAIEAVRDSIRRQRQAGLSPSLILTSPTGSGKTAMAGFMTRRNVEKGGSVYFLCHRRELIEQTSLTFDRLGLRHSVISAGYNFVPRNPIQIASVNTLANRLSTVRAPSLAIWDECHHVGARTWARIREAWKDTIHIGLTATPQRLDGKGLGSWFNELVRGPSVAGLIESGHLSQYEIFAPVVAKDFKKRAGEFIRSEMENALGQGEIMGGIVDQWLKRAENRKTIGFAISVKHSEALVQRFKDAGITAAHLDAQSAPWARRAVLQSFARGDIQVLFNVDLFGEGFDLAANSGMDCNVEAVILARPTASLGLHLQQVGRALRPKDQPAIILDHAGNTLRHGFPDDDRDWSLEDAEVKKSSQTTTKTCPACFFVCRVYAQSCPSCGYSFEANKKPREVAEVEGELMKIDRSSMSRSQARELEERELHLDALRKIAKVRGLSEGWAEKTLNSWMSRREGQTALRAE